MSRFAIILITLLFPLFSMGLPTKAEQKRGIDAALLHLSQNYGMQDFKARHFELIIEDLRSKYYAMVDAALLPEEYLGIIPQKKRDLLSYEEFQQLKIALGSDFKDGHLNILRNSKDYYSLGILAAGIGERLYVTGFDMSIFLPEGSTYKLKVGDQITHLNGVPVSELIRTNRLYLSSATETSRMNSSQQSIINVSNRFLLGKEAGSEVELTFSRLLRNGQRGTFSGRYRWVNRKEILDLKDDIRVFYPDLPPGEVEPATDYKYDGEDFGDKELRGDEFPESREVFSDDVDTISETFMLDKELKAARRYVYGRSSTTDSYFFAGLMQQGLRPGQFIDIGTLINTRIEQSGSEIAKPVTRLRAYTVDYKGKKIGVIRMPSYSPNSFQEVKNEVIWLRQAMLMLSNTDVLVVDHNHNGGGYNYLGTQFLRLFANEPLDAMEINLKINDQVYRIAKDWFDGEGFDGEAPLFTRELANKKLMEEWKKIIEEGNGSGWSGRLPFMSNLVRSGDDLSSIITAKEGYTYPGKVLLLNDERSASNGDFIPKILKMNGRAIIYGARSGGLGGPVWGSIENVPGTYMYMRCTQGECFPPDEVPIENIGVAPDVYRAIRHMDLLTDFSAYSLGVIESAVAYADGANAEQLQVIADASKMRKKSKQIPILITQISELNQKLDPRNQNAQAIRAYYGKIAFLIQQAKQKEDLEAMDFFRQLPIIHPAEALKSEDADMNDLMLGQFTEIIEIENRLVEMRGMKKYAPIHNLIDMILPAYSNMREFKQIRTAPVSCDAVFL